MRIINDVISLPYKTYQLRLQSSVLRKLTVVEWMVMNIADRFSANRTYQKRTLGNIIENTLHINNCEQLIKPCVDEMVKYELLDIEGYSKTTVASRLRIEELCLTIEGKNVVQRNYIPRESHESEETVYYDVLSGTFSSFLPDSSKLIGEGKRVVTRNPFDVEFQEEDLRNSINNGKLFHERYYAKHLLVRQFELVEENDEWHSVLLTVNLDENGHLYTDALPSLTPELVSFIDKLFDNPYNGHPMDKNMQAVDLIGKKELYTGNQVAEHIRKLSESAKIMIVKDDFYKTVSKSWKKGNSGRIWIVFGAISFSVERADNLVVYLPSTFPQSGCVFLTDKAGCINYVNCSLDFEGRERVYALAFTSQSESNPIEWVENCISEHVNENIAILALYALPFFDDAENRIRKRLNEIWAEYKTSFDRKFCAVCSISDTSSTIALKDLPIERIITDIIVDEEFVEYHQLKGFITEAVTRIALLKNTDTFLAFFAKCLVKATYINSYDDVIKSVSLMDICPGTSAVSFKAASTTECEYIYSSAVLDDLFQRFWYQIPEQLQEYTAFEQYFNQTVKCMLLIQGMLPSFVWYHVNEDNALLESVVECNNLPLVETRLHEFTHVLSVLRASGCVALEGENFRIPRENLEHLICLVGEFIMPEGENIKPVYIIDTCAFINTPDLLNLFYEDELIRIPTKVISELDKHKSFSMDPVVKQNAQIASRNIETALKKSESNNNLRISVENASTDLLPQDLDPTSPDCMILSVAIKYKTLNPTIITDDTSFRNIIRSQQIRTKAWFDFVSDRGAAARRTNQQLQNIHSMETGDLNELKAEMLHVFKDELPSEGDTSITRFDSTLKQDINRLKSSPYHASPKAIGQLKSSGIKKIGEFYALTDDQVATLIPRSQVVRNELSRIRFELNKQSALCI